MASQSSVPIKAFPQLQWRNRLAADWQRALVSRATNNEFFFRLINRDFKRGFGALGLPDVGPVGERIAADLKGHGIAFAHFSELFPKDLYEAIVLAFNDYKDSFLKERELRGGKLNGKEIIIDTIHKAHHFLAEDAVSNYLASPLIAGISARYMDMVPRYVGSSFWHTKPAPSDERVYSQLWHRDYNDRRLVKFFLYLNDVGLNSGYFEYVTGTHAQGALGRTFDSIGPDGYRCYPDQAGVDKMVADAPVIDLSTLRPDKYSGASAPWSKGQMSRILCTGKAGAMIFCDTFGLHRGGFVKNGYRDLIMGTYSTNFNVHKPHFSVSPEFTAGLTPFMRLAFGLELDGKRV